ncbi:MAG: Verru_Chthon cassette protein C [Verrucomicrobia bacterium]|nr:Verru_Chthon cassette protein C [Verrucomicrobiota bacterium]
MQIFSPQFNAARPLRSRAGFSILEVLVASAVLALLLVAMLSMTDQVQKTYRSTLGKAEQFREARVAFESITRRLSQATLNTYWDYDSLTTPTRYLRQSELRFLSGQASAILPGTISSTTHAVFFQAPFGFSSNATAFGGMESMVNTWGYFIEFGSDSGLRPPPVNTAGVPEKYRFRLYEMMEPSESLSLYKYTGNSTASKTYTGRTWFTDALDKPNRSSRVLAENIVALIFRPLDPASTPSDLTTNFTYDTAGSVANIRNQLPPYIEVTMVAIDEVSARRLETGATPPVLGLTGLFQTASSYDGDLEKLRKYLDDNDKKINYRIFTANVSIQGAKWSRN